MSLQPILLAIVMAYTSPALVHAGRADLEVSPLIVHAKASDSDTYQIDEDALVGKMRQEFDAAVRKAATNRTFPPGTTLNAEMDIPLRESRNMAAYGHGYCPDRFMDLKLSLVDAYGQTQAQSTVELTWGDVPWVTNLTKQGFREADRDKVIIEYVRKAASRAVKELTKRA